MMHLFFIALACLLLACQSGRHERPEQVDSGSGIAVSENHPGQDESPASLDIVCLVYHRFGDSRYPSTNIGLAEFEEHLKYLKNNQFDVITLGEAVGRMLSSGSQEKPVAVITVDDGYRSFSAGAMPLLKKYGYRATLFVNTESVGGGDYLGWEDLKNLLRDSIEIGNHSHAHTQFLNISGAERLRRFRDDVQQAQDLFARHLGFRPDLFAYPYGEFVPEMRPVLMDMGFRAAAAQKSGVFASRRELYAIPRFPMGGSFARMESYREKVNMKALPVEEVMPENPVITGSSLPVLRLRLKPGQIRHASLQAFVGGSNVQPVVEDSTGMWIRVDPGLPVSSRRTPYTLTAPLKGGGWGWYTHLFVHPETPE
jgi:peptidoglycan/xylan/chitin deacetylase (PgdA/CDA1 family)